MLWAHGPAGAPRRLERAAGRELRVVLWERWAPSHAAPKGSEQQMTLYRCALLSCLKSPRFLKPRIILVSSEYV